jgi:hypothetical protein
MPRIVAIALFLGLVAGPTAAVACQATVPQAAFCKRANSNPPLAKSNLGGDDTARTVTAQNCPIPQCSGGLVVCDIRPRPDGCLQWRCCPRR